MIAASPSVSEPETAVPPRRQGGGARHRPHASLARGTRSPYTLNKESGTPNRFLVRYTNAKSALAYRGKMFWGELETLHVCTSVTSGGMWDGAQGCARPGSAIDADREPAAPTTFPLLTTLGACQRTQRPGGPVPVATPAAPVRATVLAEAAIHDGAWESVYQVGHTAHTPTIGGESAGHQ